MGSRRERRALGAVSPSAHAADQAVSIEDGVDGALGGHAQVTGQPAHQQLTDLAHAPVRLAALEAYDEALAVEQAGDEAEAFFHG